jgi:hypothetical protein
VRVGIKKRLQVGNVVPDATTNFHETRFKILNSPFAEKRDCHPAKFGGFGFSEHGSKRQGWPGKGSVHFWL